MFIMIWVAAQCSSCSSGKFVDARLRYGNPETGKSEVVPAVVYVKNGKIKSIVVDR